MPSTNLQKNVNVVFAYIALTWGKMKQFDSRNPLGHGVYTVKHGYEWWEIGGKFSEPSEWDGSGSHGLFRCYLHRVELKKPFKYC